MSAGARRTRGVVSRHQVYQQRGDECKPEQAEEPAEELAEDAEDVTKDVAEDVSEVDEGETKD
jgi:seryl-tRNA synthetase